MYTMENIVLQQLSGPVKVGSQKFCRPIVWTNGGCYRPTP